MGEVFCAHDTKLGRHFALKMLPRQLASRSAHARRNARDRGAELTTAGRDWADAFSVRNLREWNQVLEAMVPSTFARWLTSDGERALRLRRSLPLTFLRALEADAGAKP
jgi:hypothetical protein